MTMYTTASIYFLLRINRTHLKLEGMREFFILNLETLTLR